MKVEFSLFVLAFAAGAVGLMVGRSLPAYLAAFAVALGCAAAANLHQIRRHKAEASRREYRSKPYRF